VLRRSSLLALLLLALLSPATSSAGDAASGDWLTWWYLAPQPERLGELVPALGPALSNPHAFGSLTGFLCFALQEAPPSPEELAGWADRAGRTPLIFGLRCADPAGARRLAVQDGWDDESLAWLDGWSGQPTDLLDGPARLDALWGAFFATGDTSHVDAIIDVASRRAPKTDPLRAVTVEAARWSVGSNARQHELVFRALSRRADQKGKRGRWARETLAGLGVVPVNWQGEDGPFVGLLVVTDDVDFLDRWASTSAREPVGIDAATTAPPGGVVIITPAFAGFELSEDLRADVVWDVRVTDADGTEKMAATDVPALVGLAPNRFYVQVADGMVKLSCEGDTKEGVFTVTATLRDRLGGKRIALEGSIECLPDEAP